MPSELVTQILEITDIRPHPNADRLELATLGGWQIVCGKDLYKEGERVVYITPDSLITEKLADILEIKQHLSSVKNPDGSFVTNDDKDVMLRVRQAKLRGEPSFGTTIPADVMLNEYSIDINILPLGTNLAGEIGVLKYEPQMRASAGDSEVDHALFSKYTNISNLRNFPDILNPNEMVVVTEKIHGTNCRVGMIEGEWFAGSHALRRKNPAYDAVTFDNKDVDKVWERNTYWYPLSLKSVRDLIRYLSRESEQVIIYGEVYGNVQKKYTYDAPNKLGFRAFDIYVGGEYLNYFDFKAGCQKFGVPFVPMLGVLPYNYQNISDFMESVDKSTLGEHPMEGAVIRPVMERTDSKIGRVIFKYLTNKYLFDNKRSDYKDE